ncbi:hypothetical protein JXA80_02580, partial [bacterium]|nr:hypothetical protein [candidate division CSSED10-310 bacterium]
MVFIVGLVVAAGIWLPMLFTDTDSLRPFSLSNENLTNQLVTPFADFSLPIDADADRLFVISGGSGVIQSEEPSHPWISRRYGLILKGTAGTGMAVVSTDGDDSERVVRAGDMIGNVRIAAIRRNRIVLEGPLGEETLAIAPDPVGTAELDGDDPVRV